MTKSTMLQAEKQDSYLSSIKYADLIRMGHVLRNVKIYWNTKIPKLENGKLGIISKEKIKSPIEPNDIILEIQYEEVGRKTAEEVLKIIKTKQDRHKDRNYMWTSIMIARYTRTSCKTKKCHTPLYEMVQRPSGYTCSSCGLIASQIISSGPERILNCEGKIDWDAQRCALPTSQYDGPPPAAKLGRKRKGEKYDPSENTYKKRHLKALMSQMYDLANAMGLRQDDMHLVYQSISMLQKYTEWLHSSYNKFGEKRRQKHVGWMVCATFMWFSVLLHECRINVTTLWSLRKICEAATECQGSDCYSTFQRPKKKVRRIKRFSKPAEDNKKERQTRAVRFTTVHRYAEEIAEEWPEFKYKLSNIKIPPLNSMGSQRNSNMNDTVVRFATLEGKSPHTYWLPYDKPWDMDLELIDNCITVKNIDVNGPGFQCGIRNDDIINGLGNTTFNVDTNVPKAVEILKQCKIASKPVKVFILR